MSDTVHFNDGFDRPDVIAFGLTAPQLLTMAVAAAASAGLIRTSVPAWISWPLAVALSGCVAIACWGRWMGVPLLHWAFLAARHAVTPRQTTLILTSAADGDGTTNQPARSAPGPRRVGRQAATDGGPPDEMGTPTGSPAWARWLEPPAASSPPPPAGDDDPGAHDMGATERDGVPPSATTEADGWPLSGELQEELESTWDDLGAQLTVADAPATVADARATVALAIAPTTGAAAPADNDDTAALTIAPTPGSWSPADDDGTVSLVVARTPGPSSPADDDDREDDVVEEFGRILPFARARDDSTPEPMLESAATSLPSAPFPIATVAENPAGHHTSANNVSANNPSDAPPAFVGATRRITFFSLSGGTGKTTLATELACLLAARGEHSRDGGATTDRLRVALIDLDLRSASVAVRLGIPQPTIWDLASQPSFDAGAVHDFMVRHPSGLRALLGPPKPLQPTSTVITAERVSKIVAELEKDGVHFLIFDITGELTPVTSWVLHAVHDIFVVLTPTAKGVQDAYRSTEALRKMGLRHKLAYVVNRARDSVDMSIAMGDLGGRIVAEIPLDPRVEDAENAHRIVSLEGGPAADAIVSLAATVYPGLRTAAPRRRGIFGRRRRNGR